MNEGPLSNQRPFFYFLPSLGNLTKNGSTWFCCSFIDARLGGEFSGYEGVVFLRGYRLVDS
jgi:hypothetical protein